MSKVKVDRDQKGRKVKLLDGSKEIIVKVTQRHGYETESGYVIRPEALRILARSCRELEIEDDESTADSGNRRNTKRKSKRTRDDVEKPAKKTKKAKRAKSEKDEKPSKKTKKEKPAKKPRKAVVMVEEEEDDVPSGKHHVKRRSPRVESAPKSKRVSKITKAVSDAINEYLTENLQDMLSAAGYDLTVGFIGAHFRDDRLLVELGILPTNASESDILEYVNDYKAQQDEDEDFGDDLDDSDDEEDEDLDDSDDEEDEDLDDSDDEEDEEEDLDDSDDEEDEEEDLDDSDDEEDDEDEDEIAAYVEMVTDQTSVDEDRATSYVSQWFEDFDAIEDKLGDEVSIGTLLEHKKSGAVFYVVGWNADKSKVVLWDTETEKLTSAYLEMVARMEIIDAEAEEEEDFEDDDTLNDDASEDDDDWSEFEDNL